MLYLTTRDKFDAHTTAKALNLDRAEDGGYYIPFQMPVFKDATVWEGKTFAQTVAEILNLFFSCRITSWDVELAVGKRALKLENLQQRICVCELWHNLDMTYQGLERILSALVTKGQSVSAWLRIAIRISVLFAVYGELLRKQTVKPDTSFDLALPEADFSVIMAAWYAKKMGLPIENVICGCEEESAVWDLLNFGEVKLTDSAVPMELERLICGVFGPEEVQRFCELSKQKGTYSLLPADLEKLRAGMFAAVISEGRMSSVIPNVYRTAGYVLAPDAAVSYAALSDFRAKTGESRTALIFADNNPVCDGEYVSSVMNITRQELDKILGMI